MSLLALIKLAPSLRVSARLFGVKVARLMGSEKTTFTEEAAAGWMNGVTGPICTMAGGTVFVER